MAIRSPDQKKAERTLGALLTTGEDEKSILKKLRSNDEWQSVIDLKNFLEANFPKIKINFHELEGFTNGFRKRYISLLKQGFLKEAKDLWQNLGEGMNMSEEVKDALSYCMENNRGIFCDIVSDRLSKGVNIKQLAREAASHQTRKLITSLLTFMDDCGISVSLDVVRLAVIEEAVSWKEAKKDKNKQ